VDLTVLSVSGAIDWTVAVRQPEGSYQPELSVECFRSGATINQTAAFSPHSESGPGL